MLFLDSWWNHRNSSEHSQYIRVPFLRHRQHFATYVVVLRKKNFILSSSFLLRIFAVPFIWGPSTSQVKLKSFGQQVYLNICFKFKSNLTLGTTNKVCGVACWMNSAVPIIYAAWVSLWNAVLSNIMVGRICHETAYISSPHSFMTRFSWTWISVTLLRQHCIVYQ